MILELFLFFSLVVNLFFVWYVRELLVRFNFVSSKTEDFFAELMRYEEHLVSVYELPVFYGEPTLEGLIQHTRDIKDEVGLYKELFSITDEEVVENTEEQLD